MQYRATEMVDRLFNNFATTTASRSFFVYDIKGDLAKWSQNAVNEFRLPGAYVQKAKSVLENIIHPADRTAFNDEFARLMKSTRQSYDASYRLRNGVEEYVTCEFKVSVVRDYAGRPAYLAVSVFNRKRNTHHDTVTDLPNRFELLNDLRDKKELRHPSVLLALGTTNFASVNKLYGYAFGNAVLKALAGKLVELMGTRGSAYRTQGACVMMLSDTMSLSDVQQLYKEMCDYAMRGLSVDGVKLSVRMCGGVVVYDDFTVDEHTIYTCVRYGLDRSERSADHKLVAIRNDNLGERKNTVSIVQALRTSIAKGCEDFYLCYQPIVSSLSDKLLGCEVLLRYDKSPFGKIPPDLFIPVLENDEAFPQLGYWIIETAARETKPLLETHPDLMVHINLNYVQLEQAKFRNTMLEILKRTDFPGKNLLFELTERCKNLDPLFLKDEIYFFKTCGIRSALDGKCLTSLELLRTLPVDMMKIDRDMVSRIETDVTDQYLLEAVTGFARKMRIQVCIEGVENERRKNFLRKFPVSAYQGYYYSEPVRIDEFLQLPIYRVSAEQKTQPVQRTSGNTDEMI